MGLLPSVLGVYLVRERLIRVPGLPFPKGTELITKIPQVMA